MKELLTAVLLITSIVLLLIGFIGVGMGSPLLNTLPLVLLGLVGGLASLLIPINDKTIDSTIESKDIPYVKLMHALIYKDEKAELRYLIALGLYDPNWMDTLDKTKEPFLTTMLIDNDEYIDPVEEQKKEIGYWAEINDEECRRVDAYIIECKNIVMVQYCNTNTYHSFPKFRVKTYDIRRYKNKVVLSDLNYIFSEVKDELLKYHHECVVIKGYNW